MQPVGGQRDVGRSQRRPRWRRTWRAASSVALAAKPGEDFGQYVDEKGKVRSVGIDRPSLKTVERVCRALRRLALNAENAIELGDCGAMKPLLHVMETVDNHETRSQSGNALVSMAATEKYRQKIGRLDAIPAFQKFLDNNGTPIRAPEHWHCEKTPCGCSCKCAASLNCNLRHHHTSGYKKIFLHC